MKKLRAARCVGAARNIFNVSLAMFEMFDFVSDPVDFVECDESGCKGQDMESEVDKEVFVPAMAMLMIFFHNL